MTEQKDPSMEEISQTLTEQRLSSISLANLKLEIEVAQLREHSRQQGVALLKANKDNEAIQGELQARINESLFIKDQLSTIRLSHVDRGLIEGVMNALAVEDEVLVKLVTALGEMIGLLVPATTDHKTLDHVMQKLISGTDITALNKLLGVTKVSIPKAERAISAGEFVASRLELLRKTTSVARTELYKADAEAQYDEIPDEDDEMPVDIGGDLGQVAQARKKHGII